MNREQIKALALQHGFTLRENDDLRPYVYEFAEALVEAERQRGDALAGVVAALRDLVTVDHETKESFIQRVRSVLGQDPDERIDALRADAKEVHAARGFLRQQDRLLRELAAAQAREAKLREKVTLALGILPHNPDFVVADVLATARAIPTDDTALRERLAAERERIAKWFEKRAEDYAAAFGHYDMGALSFGSGPRAEVKMDYHSELMENAEAIRAMGDSHAQS